MQIVLKECHNCGTIKEFWLKDTQEAGFYCKCGSSQKMRNYYGADYMDYFIGLLDSPLTLENILDLAQKHHMHIDHSGLRRELSGYNLANLTEAEFYQVMELVWRSNDVFRFRKALMQYTDLEQMLQAIANHNPRIDLPGLRGYLEQFDLPLTEKQVIEMEKEIEQSFYHLEIDEVTYW